MRIVVLRAGGGEVTEFVGDELVSVLLMAMASLANIPIGSLSERLGFFTAREMYFGERPAGGRPLWYWFLE